MALLLFDLDGTLIESYLGDDGKPVAEFERVAPLPKVVDVLGELRSSGHQLGIITNQAGVAFGHETRDAAEDKLQRACDALGVPALWPDRVWVCYHHPKATIEPYGDKAGCARRKPSGAMILEAIEYSGAGVHQTVYVGDMDSDRSAALHAGVRFVWADEFFGWVDPPPRPAVFGA